MGGCRTSAAPPTLTGRRGTTMGAGTATAAAATTSGAGRTARSIPTAGWNSGRTGRGVRGRGASPTGSGPPGPGTGRPGRRRVRDPIWHGRRYGWWMQADDTGAWEDRMRNRWRWTLNAGTLLVAWTLLGCDARAQSAGKPHDAELRARLTPIQY